MTNKIDATGLTIDTINEIIDSLTTGLKVIYGSDINVGSNTPDGQLINLISQVKEDLLELSQQIYNSFDPDKALGRVLDERVSINNIQRKGGTYTQQPIELITDRALNLQGLDGDADEPDGQGYTVSDNSGNEFILLDSQVIASSGTNTFTFRARNIGKVETLPNTITNPVVVVLGITNINNPSVASEVGVNEETDAELKLRREKSVAQGSLGYLDGLLGALLNIENVSDGKVYENKTSSVDADGIPAHSIWPIVEGGANDDIANTIYTRKSYGCGMRGSVQVDVIGDNGLPFEAKFDRPTPEDLYIKYDLKPTTGVSFDLDAIKDSMVATLLYGIGDDAETSRITTESVNAININGGGGVPINVQISDDDITYTDFLSVSTKDKKWLVSKLKIAITII